MTDFLLLEQLHKTAKELIKPRLMFKKGIWTCGYFRPYMSLADYTSASIFKSSDEIIPVTVRFSSMLGDSGTADTVRNIKGMGIRFNADDGIYDMICQNIPIIFINDKNDIIRSMETFKIRSMFDGINREAFWRFVTNNPSSLNFAIRLYSYYGLSDSFVNINQYSVNISLWQNDKGEEWLIRYKWLPVLENDNDNNSSSKRLGKNEAEFIAGYDPHRAIEEIENKLKASENIKFELFVQMINKRNVSDINIYDHTYKWNDKRIPYLSVGILLIDRLSNVCYDPVLCPGNTIRGIEIWRNDLIDIIDHMCVIESIERGDKI